MRLVQLALRSLLVVTVALVIGCSPEPPKDVPSAQGQIDKAQAAADAASQAAARTDAVARAADGSDGESTGDSKP